MGGLLDLQWHEVAAISGSWTDVLNPNSDRFSCVYHEP